MLSTPKRNSKSDRNCCRRASSLRSALLAATILTLPRRTIPAPTAQARGDAVILARHFLDTYCLQYRRPPMRLAAVAVERIRRATWPGNVRELQNLILGAIRNLQRGDNSAFGREMPSRLGERANTPSP